jgi:preprotein translocase subunit SecG
MSVLIVLFTAALVLDCLLLMLLVLIQLPKKEAGLGQAFGGSTTDALFGAGSGTALTKLTKYTAGIFFALTLLISILHGHQTRNSGGDPRNLLSTEDKLSMVTPSGAPKTNAATPATTNSLLSLTNAPTNAAQQVEKPK